MIHARIMICGVGLFILSSCAVTSSSIGQFSDLICAINQLTADATKGIPVGAVSLNGTTVAQTIRTPVSTDLSITKVKLGLYRQGWPNGQLTLRIQTDNGGSPSGVDVSAAAVQTLAYTSNESLMTSTFRTYAEYFDFDFSSAVALTKDTVYWVTLKTSAAVNASTYVLWAAANGNLYTSGAAYYENATTGSPIYTHAQITTERDTVFALCTPSPTATETAAAEVPDESLQTAELVLEPRPEPTR